MYVLASLVGIGFMVIWTAIMLEITQSLVALFHAFSFVPGMIHARLPIVIRDRIDVYVKEMHITWTRAMETTMTPSSITQVQDDCSSDLPSHTGTDEAESIAPVVVIQAVFKTGEGEGYEEEEEGGGQRADSHRFGGRSSSYHNKYHQQTVTDRDEDSDDDDDGYDGGQAIPIGDDPSSTTSATRYLLRPEYDHDNGHDVC